MLSGKMGSSMVLICFVAIIACISQVRGFGMHRHKNHYQPEPCTTSCEEIKTLLNLARMLEEEDKPKANSFNAEDLIMKLVNALIVTSTSQNKCNCDYSYGRSDSTAGSRSSQSSRGHRDGLINLDLLNPNNPNNVAQLDLGKQTVAGIGIGDTTNGVVGGALKDLL